MLGGGAENARLLHARPVFTTSQRAANRNDASSSALPANRLLHRDEQTKTNRRRAKKLSAIISFPMPNRFAKAASTAHLCAFLASCREAWNPKIEPEIEGKRSNGGKPMKEKGLGNQRQQKCGTNRRSPDDVGTSARCRQKTSRTQITPGGNSRR